jgi:hypothetical protein
MNLRRVCLIGIAITLFGCAHDVGEMNQRQRDAMEKEQARRARVQAQEDARIERERERPRNTR